MRWLAKVSLWLGCLAAVGCATDLSTLQTAKTLPPGKFGGVTSVALNVPPGTLSAISKGDATAKKLDEAIQNGQPYVFTQSDQESLLGSAVALAVLPPTVSYELTLRAGFATDWELGLRYGINAARFDVKRHLVHWDDDQTPWPMDLALGGGFSHYFFNNSGVANLGYAHVIDFNRFDLELPVYLSADLSPRWTAYGAAKYVYSRSHLTGTLSGAGFSEPLPLPGLLQSDFLGLTVGSQFALNYFHLRAYLELTVGYTGLSPFLLDHKESLGGVTLFPALGLGTTM